MMLNSEFIKQEHKMQFMATQACTDPVEFPLYSYVQAGFPSPAEENTTHKIDLNKHIIKHPASTFFVRVSGDSMQDKGIYHNDLIVVDRSLEAKSGNIIIACLNREFTIKELKKQNGRIILKAANKNYADIHIKESDDFEIWGVVTNVIREL